MKYLKYFESVDIYVNGECKTFPTKNAADYFLNSKYMERIEFIYLDSKLKELLNILGFTLTSRILSNIVNNKTQYWYDITLNFNMNQQEKGILSTLVESYLNEIKGNLLDEMYVNTSRNNVKNLRIYITNNLEDLHIPTGNDFYVVESDKTIAYKLIINKLLKIFEDRTNLIFHNGISEVKFNCKKIIRLFLRANKNFKEPIIIPDDAMEEFYRGIKTFNNAFQIINNLKKSNPILYKRLIELNKESEIASSMGDLGF